MDYHTCIGRVFGWSVPFFSRVLVYNCASVPLILTPFVRARCCSLTRQRRQRSAAWQLLKAARVRLLTVVDLAVAAADSLLHKRCGSRLRIPRLPPTWLRWSALQLHAVPMSRARRAKGKRQRWALCCCFVRRPWGQRLLVTRGTRQQVGQAVPRLRHASKAGLLGPSHLSCPPCA